MRLFFQRVVEEDAQGTSTNITPNDDLFLKQAKQAVDILCDEARLDPAV